MISYKQWGDDIEGLALSQMENACNLPISVAAALMPDAHPGYGLPIGGVLATDNAVIPYAVGMDIACRMKMTVFDVPVSLLTSQADKLENALIRGTQFGLGTRNRNPLDHPVMELDWGISPVTRKFKQKAHEQLGSSGTSNHFADLGVLTIDEPVVLWSSPQGGGRHRNKELRPGEYLALLTHSGSRGTGGEVAKYYSKFAASLHPELPPALSSLAWLDLDSDPGREYWAAMELMGQYAAANHELVHKTIARTLKADVLADVENHHNFAWRENHHGRDVIVHRKGATPAAKGVLGVIPSSMATPAYVIRGKGAVESLCSASHGAGRRMSRAAAKSAFTLRQMKDLLVERGVKLISGSLDESPLAYKDIGDVMKAQEELVEIVARFDPKIVRMSDGKGKSES